MNDWDKILKDFAYKCGDGGPNMTNPNHLALLRESLLKFGWKENATNEFIGNLREGEKKYSDNTKNRALGRVGLPWGSKGTPPEREEPKGEDEGGIETTEQAIELINQNTPLEQTQQQGQRQEKLDQELVGLIEQLIPEETGEVVNTGVNAHACTREEIIALRTLTEKRKEQNKNKEKAREENKKLQQKIDDGEELTPEEEAIMFENQETIDEEPWHHPDVMVRHIDGEYDEETESYGGTLGLALDELERKMGKKDFNKLMAKLAASGGVDDERLEKSNHLTTSPATPCKPGFHRARNLVRLFLKYDGKSVVTGIPMRIEDFAPDHRVPFSNARENAKRNGTTVEEEQAKLDDPSKNMDLMEHNINFLKLAKVDQGLIDKLNEKLNATDDEKEQRRLEFEVKRTKNEGFYNFHSEQFANGDYSQMTEENINSMDDIERDQMMKAYNYYHPSMEEKTEQVTGKKKGKQVREPDPEYYNKLKKYWANQDPPVILPDNPEDVDYDKPPFSQWIPRYFPQGTRYKRGDLLKPGYTPPKQKGGSRKRSLHRPDEDEKAYMIDHWTKEGETVSTQSQIDEETENLHDARKISLKSATETEIKLLQVKIKITKEKNPNSHWIKKYEAKIAELEDLL